jgi:tRNA C32,U32 (ribose-2'-O)-methylase TrmJ
MDAQELRNLQEAYLEVVMNEETDKTGNHLDTYASKKYFGDKEKQEKLMRRMNRLRGKTEQQKEQVDIYDIILSHLLDKGYAETPEAAEAIMVNMSEEWRNSIIG